MEERLARLKDVFRGWLSAKGLDLKFVGKGWAKAILPITAEILSPHQIPMIVGKEIESAAAKLGVLAAMTLVEENEYVVYSHDAATGYRNLFEPTIPEEKCLEITATVSNDRMANSSLISVRVLVKNIYGREKAEYDFYYRVLPREKMEQKLAELKKLAEDASQAAH